jgi:hypothetical protein
MIYALHACTIQLASNQILMMSFATCCGHNLYSVNFNTARCVELCRKPCWLRDALEEWFGIELKIWCRACKDGISSSDDRFASPWRQELGRCYFCHWSGQRGSYRALRTFCAAQRVLPLEHYQLTLISITNRHLTSIDISKIIVCPPAFFDYTGFNFSRFGRTLLSTLCHAFQYISVSTAEGSRVLGNNWLIFGWNSKFETVDQSFSYLFFPALWMTNSDIWAQGK